MRTSILRTFLLLLIIVMGTSSFAGIANKDILKTKITISVKNEDLKKIFTEIENRTGIKFAYKESSVKNLKGITLNCFDEILSSVLGKIDAQQSLKYEIRGDIIIVTIIDTNKVFHQPRLSSHTDAPPVRGIVQDKNGQPIAGASVQVKGNAAGTITNERGEFEINTSLNNMLIISSSGYQTREVLLKDIDGRIVVVLEESFNNMEEVIVVGYGTMRRKDVTGAISSINGEEMQKASTATFQDALQGRLAGVQVIASDGSPGGGMQIKIRGGSTLTAGNQPLYVVDGFPITPVLGADYNPMADINPSDIASVEVLKDASATAIYGAEGANGVILITTKKGRLNSKPIIDFGTYMGITDPILPIRILTPEEYIKYKVEILTQNPEQIAEIPNWQAKDPATGHVWMDEITQYGKMYNGDIGVRGGSNNGLTYSTNLNYYNEKGIIKKSEYERISARVNLDQQIGKKFKIGVKMFYSNIDLNGFMQEYYRENSIFKQALMMSPFSLGVPTQTVTDFTADNEQNNNDNNLNALINNSTKKRKLERIQPSMTLQYKILKDLVFDFMYGQDRTRMEFGTFYPTNTRQGFPTGRAQIINSSSFNWYQNTRLNYNKVFNKVHRLDLVGVYETKSGRDNSYDQSASGFSTDILGLGNLQLANSLSKPIIRGAKQNYISYIARANYTYADRYMATLTYRRDGSSKFGINNPWANFPAVGLAWRVSEEKFLKDNKVLSNFKIRYGWGVTGNSQIPPYSSLAVYESDLAIFNNELTTVIVPTNIGNKDLKWETTTQNNLGIDLGLMEDKIGIIIDVYDKVTKDLLLNVQLPTATGYTSAIQNIGSMQNRGFEFTLNSVNIDKAFRWTSNFNLFLNRSKVLKLGQSARQLYTYALANGMQNNILIKEGYPVGVFFGYVGDGVYNTVTEADNSPVNNVISKTGRNLWGEMKFADINGDGILNSFDQVPLAYTEPKFLGGLVNNFYYKNFELGIVLRGSYGNDIVNGNIGDFNEMSLSTNNLKGNVDNMWRAKDPMLDYIGVTKTGRRPYMHSEYIEDGSFLRCDRISLGYSFQKKTLARMKLNLLKVYFNLRNAFLITNYSWYDPEVSTGSVNALKLAPGVDLGAYPRTRQYQLGLNLSL